MPTAAELFAGEEEPDRGRFRTHKRRMPSAPGRCHSSSNGGGVCSQVVVAAAAALLAVVFLLALSADAADMALLAGADDAASSDTANVNSSAYLHAAAARSPLSSAVASDGLWTRESNAEVSSGATPSAERTAVNPHDFRYLLNNPELCRGEGGDGDTARGAGASNGIDLLAWVNTEPLHFKQRTLIRETWGNPLNFPLPDGFSVRLAFFVGDPLNGSVQALLSLESEKYGDIVQEDFVDSYRNLTYKSVMGLKWAHTYCSGARTILKADDDVLVDVFRLARHLTALREHGVATERTIMCNWVVDAFVMREGKWAVARDEYGGTTYPPYCPGLALLMTPDLIGPLYAESLRTPYFWVDDVYFTGILVQSLKSVNRHPLSAIISEYRLKPEVYLSSDSDHIFIHVHSFDLFLTLWRKMAAINARCR